MASSIKSISVSSREESESASQCCSHPSPSSLGGGSVDVWGNWCRVGWRIIGDVSVIGSLSRSSGWDCGWTVVDALAWLLVLPFTLYIALEVLDDLNKSNIHIDLQDSTIVENRQLGKVI